MLKYTPRRKTTNNIDKATQKSLLAKVIISDSDFSKKKPNLFVQIFGVGCHLRCGAMGGLAVLPRHSETTPQPYLMAPSLHKTFVYQGIIKLCLRFLTLS